MRTTLATIALLTALPGLALAQDSTYPDTGIDLDLHTEDEACSLNHRHSESAPVVVQGDSEWACPPSWLSGQNARPDGDFYGCRVTRDAFCDRDGDGVDDPQYAGMVLRVCTLQGQCYYDWNTGQAAGGELAMCGSCDADTLVDDWSQPAPEPSAPQPPADCLADGTCDEPPSDEPLPCWATAVGCEEAPIDDLPADVPPMDDDQLEDEVYDCILLGICPDPNQDAAEPEPSTDCLADGTCPDPNEVAPEPEPQDEQDELALLWEHCLQTGDCEALADENGCLPDGTCPYTTSPDALTEDEKYEQMPPEVRPPVDQPLPPEEEEKVDPAPVADPNGPQYDAAVCHANYIATAMAPATVVEDSRYSCPQEWSIDRSLRPSGPFDGCRVNAADYCDRDADGFVDADQAGAQIRVCKQDQPCWLDWQTGEVAGGQVFSCGGCPTEALQEGWSEDIDPTDDVDVTDDVTDDPTGDSTEEDGAVDADDPAADLPPEAVQPPAPVWPVVLFAGTPGAEEWEFQLLMDALQTRGLAWDHIAYADFPGDVTPDEARMLLAMDAEALLAEHPGAPIYVVGASVGIYAVYEALIHFGATQRVEAVLSVGGFPPGWDEDPARTGFPGFDPSWEDVDVPQFLERNADELGSIESFVLTGGGELEDPAELGYQAFMTNTERIEHPAESAEELLAHWDIMDLMGEYMMAPFVD